MGGHSATPLPLSSHQSLGWKPHVTQQAATDGVKSVLRHLGAIPNVPNHGYESHAECFSAHVSLSQHWPGLVESSQLEKSYTK